jgi:hypothetical protein
VRRTHWAILKLFGSVCFTTDLSHALVVEVAIQEWLDPVDILNTSLVQTAVIKALVLAMAGIIFLMTHNLIIQLTPAMPNLSARYCAIFVIH